MTQPQAVIPARITYSECPNGHLHGVYTVGAALDDERVLAAVKEPVQCNECGEPTVFAFERDTVMFEYQQEVIDIEPTEP